MNTTTEQVLARLRSTTGFISGQTLSTELGVTRAAIWKAVRRLTELGYGIEAVSRRGYRLLQVGEGAIATELAPLLRTNSFGRELICLDECGSTNTEVKERAAHGAPQGLLVTADRQTQGRGRMQRPWHSPPGRNLYTSLLLRPEVAPSRVPQLSILAGLALAEAVEECAPDIPLRIKWPNDLWIGSRKVCGILCEMEAEMAAVHFVVVGVGLNVNLTEEDFPPELRDVGTSLRVACGREIARVPLLAAFLNRFEELFDHWLEADDLSPFLADYDRLALLTGRQVRIEQPRGTLAGRVVGLSPLGELLLDTPQGTVRVHSGDAHIDRASLQ
jgi:BirA family biotin operon repressor/biotin-[acetyl-CoA-carboxylase] ligase